MRHQRLCLLFLLLVQIFSLATAFAESDVPELPTIAVTQILLDQAGFSPGEIDGKLGLNTQKAITVFQSAVELPVTGDANDLTLQKLKASGKDVVKTYYVTQKDVRGPFVRIPSDFVKKSQLPAMHYSSALEAICEKFHISPKLFVAMNPKATLVDGEMIWVPNVKMDTPLAQPAEVEGNFTNRKTIPESLMNVIVSGQGSDLRVLQNGKVIFYAPISYGGKRDPLPVGKRKVYRVIANPHYQYDPSLFWDADPSDTKAIIPPGPNNPVGSVWIAINVHHYGIHGTPEPSRIGYAQSHGCVRLTNWDAARLASLVAPGTEVIFEQ